jgi:hypothetical protein
MAQEFTGASYINVENVDVFDIGLSAVPFTLAFKFYRGTSGENYYIGKGGGFSGWGVSSGHQWLAVISGGVFYFQINTATTVPASITATPPSVATWASCVITYNGSTTTLHLNGSTAGTASVSYTKPSAANRAWMGNITSGEVNDARQLAEVAIWQNAVLSAAEITALHTGFTPDQLRPQSLSFYAPLVRNLSDLRNGTALTNNGATVATHPRIIT